MIECLTNLIGSFKKFGLGKIEMLEVQNYDRNIFSIALPFASSSISLSRYRIF